MWALFVLLMLKIDVGFEDPGSYQSTVLLGHCNQEVAVGVVEVDWWIELVIVGVVAEVG